MAAVHAAPQEPPRERLPMDRIALSTTYLLTQEIPSHLLRVQQSCLKLMAYLCIHEIQAVAVTQRSMQVAARAVIARRPRYLYLCGGSDGRQPIGGTSRFDAQAGRWEPLPELRQPRVQAAGAVAAGRIFLCGGSDGHGTLGTVECFNPGMRRWEAAPPMLERRCGASAMAVGGAVYVIGGKDGDKHLSSAERFTPKPLEGIFHGRPGANMFFEKSHGEKFKWRATKFCLGLVLDAQDYIHQQACLRSKPFTLSPTTRIDVVTQGGVGVMESLAGLPAAWSGLTSSEGFLGVALRDVATDTWLLSKRRSFCGGSTWRKATDERLQEGCGNEETLTFSPEELSQYADREVTLDVVDTFHGIMGWICVRRVMISSIAMAGKWEALPPMAERRCYAAAGVLPGKLLLCGGMSDHSTCSSSVEHFHPMAAEGAGAWQYELPMAGPRAAAAAASLNGYLYVCGGTDGEGELDTVERFSADFGHWEVISAMTRPRRFPAAAVTGERLYVFGGFDGKRYIDRFEQLDEEAWRWEELPYALPGQRAFCSVGVMERIP